MVGPALRDRARRPWIAWDVGSYESICAAGRQLCKGGFARPANARHTDGMNERQNRIETALRARFAPLVLEVVDDSAKHAGHAGAAEGGQTHYSALVVTDAFIGLSRVARSRAVHEALAAEFVGGLHALALTLKTPDENVTVTFR